MENFDKGENKIIENIFKDKLFEIYDNFFREKIVIYMIASKINSIIENLNNYMIKKEENKLNKKKGWANKLK